MANNKHGANRHHYWVPEVIIFIKALEQSARKGQANDMWSLLKKLFVPLNIAAYIAWAAVGTELWLREPRSTGLLDETVLGYAAILLHGLFLFCFVTCVLTDNRKFLAKVLALSLVMLALSLCSISRFNSAPILLIVASAVTAALFSPSHLAILFVLTNLCFYFIYRNLWQSENPILSVFVYSSFQLFAMLMSWYSRQAEKRRDEVIMLNADLIATRSLLTETARDSERLRLSRELHDVAGHKLTALKLNLAALARQPDFSGHEGIHTCAQLADELLGDIRGVVQQMRMHDGMDLQAAIEKMAAPFPRPQLQLAIDENARLAPMRQAEVLLRTIQEALTNAARHSQAQLLWVVVERKDEQWLLRIRDDGRISQPWQKGNGLLGMTERLENIGGGLRLDHSDGGGMQIEAWLPMNA
jgi:signal transduction histidine kinase